MQRCFRASRGRPRSVVLALVAVLAIVAMGVPASVRAGTPTETTLTAPAGTQYGSFIVTAHVTPAPQPEDGFIPGIGFLVDGNLSGVAPLDLNGDGSTNLWLMPGTHSIVATFGPFGSWDASQSAPAEVTVAVSTAVALISSRNPALNSESVTITATVSPTSAVPGPGGAVIPGGTLSIVDALDGSTIASGPVSGSATSISIARKFAAGSHALTATYSGSADYEASQAQLTQVVNADTSVNASSLRVDYTTFYPVKDGYRDTDGIRGTLNEPASVRIRIYSPAGSLIRTVDLGLRAKGAYAFIWTGRSSTGTLLPTGKYRIVQRLTDTVNNVRSATFYVTLSHKKLIWTSVTKTLYGSQYSVYGDPGSGYVSPSRSAYYRGVRIASGSSWAAVRYSFTLHSALVYSSSFTFRVLGKSPNGTTALEGLWNRYYGSSLYVTSYDVRLIGPSYAWWAKSGDSRSHRSGSSAYGMVYVGYAGATHTFDVAKVQLTYRWAVLG
jgi:hypothetical protein